MERLASPAPPRTERISLVRGVRGSASGAPKATEGALYVRPWGSTLDSQLFEEKSDGDLLLEYREDGDRRAFEELVQRYEKELYNYLRRYLGNAEMAEDAFQQTFLQVYLKCDRFAAGRELRPWLYTIATNQAIDLQRRNKRHRMVSLDQCPTEENGIYDGEPGKLADLLCDDAPPAGDIVASKERTERVKNAVDHLPDPLRRVLSLVHYQGLKYREAAEVLSIPVGTVKSRLHAAVRKLEHDPALKNIHPN